MANPGIAVMFPSISFVESYANKIHEKISAPLQQGAETSAIIRFSHEIELIGKKNVK